VRLLFLVGLVTALAAPAGAGAVIPGTRFFFGQPDSLVRALGLRPGGAEDAAAQRVLAGPVRFFGLESEGTLYFDAPGLARARFVVERTSPHTQAYVEDQLRRMAYRRSAQKLEGATRHSTWTGPAARLELEIEAGTLRARIEPAPPGVPAAAAPPPQPPPAEALLPDTLSLAGTSHGRPPPQVIEAAPAIYPESARRASVQGVVMVLAQVDAAGRVLSVGLVRGIRELNDAALATVKRYRFAPYRDRGRAVGFWVEVPVRFVLWPDARTPGR
jgi:TonB family protein